MDIITFKIKNLYFVTYFNKTKLAKLNFGFYKNHTLSSNIKIFEHKKLINYLEKYLNQEKVDFNNIDIDLGIISKFKFDIFKTLKTIKHGTSISYKELAHRAAHPNAYRATGQILKSNQIPIILPCHRVINSDGSLGGYNGGTNLKEYLLVLEHSHEKQRIMQTNINTII